MLIVAVVEGLSITAFLTVRYNLEVTLVIRNLLLYDVSSFTSALSASWIDWDFNLTAPKPTSYIFLYVCGAVRMCVS